MVVLLMGCGGPSYHSTRGATVLAYDVRVPSIDQTLHERKVVPAEHGNWTLVLLHGYHSSPAQFLSQPLFDTLHALGRKAPVVLLLDGGADSYWHDRRDGKWGSMLQETIPPRGRVAIGGISMGGYGALLAASRDRRFCATAVMSPALWTSAGATAPGAFDDAADYARNDVFRLAPPHPLWLAVGTDDPFYTADLTYAHRAGIAPVTGSGGHDSGFWDAHMPALLRFAAHACA